MDEKLFYSATLRKNSKHAPALGVEVKPIKVNHKSKLTKVHFIAFVGAASVGGYDHGVLGLPISITRAARRVECLRSSTQKTKGKFYWRDCDITGSTDFIEKKLKTKVKTVAKFSLLTHWKEVILPALDALVRDGGPLEGFKVKFQDDGAGCHQERTYVKYLTDLFSTRGWYFTRQPPQSPLTNVLDLLVFPCLSKRVSSNNRQFGNGFVKQMKKPAIVDTVVDEFFKIPAQIIGRSFITAKHVVLNLIPEYKGYNGYIVDRKLHSGVRRKYKDHYNM